MSQSKIPKFETERLILRGVESRDIPSYQKNFNDYDIISHLADVVPWPYPENGVETFLNTVLFPSQGNDRWFWGIFEKTNPDELIGIIELRRNGPDNRGFWLAKKHWGKGYMTEAVEPVLQYAFESLEFEKLIFTNALGNARSRRIKEKTGAKFIGTRPFKFVNPDYKENEVWELTKNEWKKFRSAQMEVIERTSCRAVFVTPENEILLIKVENRDGSWQGWVTPGGGIEKGETAEEALRREMLEELSLSNFNVGPNVWLRHHKFPWAGKMYHQDEQYYLVKTEKFDPKPFHEPTGFEADAFKGFKWWKLSEIEKSKEEFSPRALASLVREIIEIGPPSAPKEVGL